MRTVSACAGVGRTTIWVADAQHTAATVSAARRADDLLGNGFPSGDVICAGTKVERGPLPVYARQSPAWSGHLSRFRPCTAAEEEMKRAAWVEIRLG
ncbi:hypothetical protein GCM10010340_66180 [Streptomyces griseoloalbus]|nr:hypothetical protein GCM10010294_50050 [Streptomyces griseoloalbus]GGW78427.1 hypothetical protein GCM10010340_66180 [Streptomyces albaduncus]